MTNTARRCCLLGLLGSILMLTGDFLFYGTFSSAVAFHASAVMAARPIPVLILGGCVGPIAAILYYLGMQLFRVVLAPTNPRLAAIAAALLGITMLIGGAYHAVFTTFGFAARISDTATRATLLEEIRLLFDTLSYISYVPGILGTLLVYALVFRGPTNFPRWLLLFMPTTLSLVEIFFGGILRSIPAPVGSLVLGGWINGSFVLFFLLATLVFWERPAVRTIQSASA